MRGAISKKRGSQPRWPEKVEHYCPGKICRLQPKLMISKALPRVEAGNDLNSNSPILSEIWGRKVLGMFETVANMLENWLDFPSNVWTTAEVTDEPENLGTATEQTGLRLCASVDACPSAPPSGEHRASVCAATESRGTGLERNVDPHARSRFANIRC